MDRDGTDPIQRCFDESYGRLVRQLYGVCGDRAEAEDVVAEAFVRAVSKRRTFERLDSPEAWLRTVAVNIARSRHRRTMLGEKLMFRSHDEAAGPRDAVDDRGDSLDVVAALRQLPQEQREALALHYLADLPVAEVAATVGAPVGTVKARLSRGRTALAAVMTADEPEVAVDAPPFDDIERRGHRRRAVRQGAAAGAAGLAVVLVVVLAQSVVGRGGDAAPPVAPSPTQVPDDRATDPVDAPRPVDAAGRAEGGLIAVVLEEGRKRELVAASRAGNESVEVPPGTSVEALPLGGYLVLRGWGGDKGVEILDEGGLGAMREVTVGGEPSAASPREVVFTIGGGPEVELLAVAPGTAQAHPLPLPTEVTTISEIRVAPGRIQGIGSAGATSSYFWSEDGGATWQTVELGADPGFGGFAAIVPSGAGEPHAVVEGGDGATVFPFVALLEMPAPGGGFVRTERQGKFAAFNGGYVDSGTPYFVAQVGSRQPYDAVGTFTFVDDRLRLVAELPDGTDLISAAPDGTLYATDGVEVYGSSDGGRSWGTVGLGLTN